MTKKVHPFSERWQTIEGVSQSIQVLDVLRRRRSLNTLSFLGKHDGRWDLRGFVFPSANATDLFEFEHHTISRVEGMAEFRKLALQDVDFSHAVLNESVWDRCIWQNVRCRDAKIKDASFRICEMSDIDFQNADLRETDFGGNSGKSATQLRNVIFSHADMRGTGHGFETHYACDFSHAKLNDVSFEGASFIDCKFAGMMDSVQFFLHSRTVRMEIIPWFSVNPDKIFSRFENVDFSEAILMGVSFRGNDLSSCRFPCDEDHLVIYHPRKVFLKARDIIEMEWKGELRRFGLSILTQGHLVEAKEHQPIDVVNKQLDIQMLGEEFGEKFFSLLSELNQRVLAEDPL